METKDQLATVLALDCDYAQGFYFSKPLEAQAAKKFITTHSPSWLLPEAQDDRPPRRIIPPAA